MSGFPNELQEYTPPPPGAVNEITPPSGILTINGDMDMKGGTLYNVNIPTNYGVSWDESADTYARTGMLAGIATGLSPTIPLPIHEGMKRCILDDSGNVLYFLDPNDSTLKADGSAATIDDQSVGNVMVQIPKFWYKHSYAGTTHTWNISTVPMSGYTIHPAFIKNGEEVEFRYAGAYEGSLWDSTTSAMVASGDIATSMYAAGDKLCSLSGEYPKTNETRAENRAAAAQRGTGWRQMDFDLMSAIQLLYIVEYADFDSQVMIGEGRTALSGGTWAADSYIGQCGKSNADGNGTNSVGGNSNNAYMTYRGIENFFGNVWTFIDGFNVNDNVPYVSNTDTEFADDTVTNYTDLGVTLANANGYQDTLEQIRRGFLPASVGASSSTKITDYYYQAAGWRVLLCGGGAGNGSGAGVFCVSAGSGSSVAYVYFGARLCF